MTMQDDLQIDSNLMEMLEIFNNQYVKIENDDDALPIEHTELYNLFSSSRIIQRVIEIYPRSATRIGYECLDDGKHTDHGIDHNLLLEAFKHASVYARIYGICYLIVYENDPKTPLKPNEKPNKFLYRTELRLVGDYYVNAKDQRIAHKTRTLFFYGVKKYQKPDYQYDDFNREYDYYDWFNSEYSSLITVLIDGFRTYGSGVKYTMKILRNLSNITIGIKDLAMRSRNERSKRDLLSRLWSFDRARRVDKAIAYDLENESINVVSQTLSDVRESIESFKEYFCAVCDVPKSKIFDEKRGATLASGYQNSIVERFEWAIQVKEWSEDHYLPQLKTLYRNLGIDCTVKIPIVIELSKLEQAELEKLCSERDKNLIESNILIPEEIRTGYRDNAFSIRIKLDDALYQKSKEDKLKTQSIAPIETQTAFTKDSLALDDELWEQLSLVTFEDLDRISEEMIDE